MPTHLLSTTFEDGLRAPHYVNGRLLAAEDLKAEREAMLTRLIWLGQASGNGVVEGLDVVQDTGRLRVSAGLGINRRGYPIRLPGDLVLSLTQLPEEELVQQNGAGGETATATVDLGSFAVCGFQPVTGVTSIPTGDYLLTVAPTVKFDGFAPVKTTPGDVSPPACAFKWEIDGLQFKAIALTQFALDVVLDKANHRRNRLAHWCFARRDARFAALGDNPFTFEDTYGGFDALPVTDLTPCDLPLAVFQWDGGRLVFVDRWSARRRLVRPHALTGWRGILSDRRVADAQARFLQFQDQIAGLGALRTPASDTFRYLPPAGLLHIQAKPLIDRVADLLKREHVGGGKLPEFEVPEAVLDLLLKRAQVSETQFADLDFSGIQLAQRAATTDPLVLELRNVVFALTNELKNVKVDVNSLKLPPGTELIPAGDTGDDVVIDVGDEPAATDETGEVLDAAGSAEAEDDSERRKQLELLHAWLTAQTTNSAGVDLDVFLGRPVRVQDSVRRRVARIGMIRRDLLDAAIQQSWYDEPIELDDELDGIKFYTVFEAMLKRENRPYVIFTRATLPVEFWADLTTPEEEPV